MTGFEGHSTEVLLTIRANLVRQIATIAALPVEQRFGANARGAVPAESATIWAVLAQHIETVLAERGITWE